MKRRTKFKLMEKATAPEGTKSRISRYTDPQVLPVEYCSTMNFINLSFNSFTVKLTRQEFKDLGAWLR